MPLRATARHLSPAFDLTPARIRLHHNEGEAMRDSAQTKGPKLNLNHGMPRKGLPANLNLSRLPMAGRSPPSENGPQSWYRPPPPAAASLDHWTSPNQELMNLAVSIETIATFGGSPKGNGSETLYLQKTE